MESKKNIFLKKRLIFLILFGIMVLIGKRINFSAVVGTENQFFTLFQFFGPIAGSFLGPLFGVVAVLGAELADFLLASKTWSLINIIRLTPMLFAAYYFGKKKLNISVIVPLIAMTLFIVHPIGRYAWFYSLYWTIPVIVTILPKKYSNNLLLRSLGATFTAHSVGSVAWLYIVPMTATQWIALIPITAYERLLFAVGIAGSYIVLNTILDKLSEKLKWKIAGDILYIDKHYIISKRLFKIQA